MFDGFLNSEDMYFKSRGVNKLSHNLLNNNDDNVQKLLNNIYLNTFELIEKNSNDIINLKKLLIEKETIYSNDIENILA